jgi:hypothetical protein
MPLRTRTTLTELVITSQAARTAMELPVPSRLQQAFAWSLVARLGGENYRQSLPLYDRVTKCNRTYDASNPEHRAISHVCLDPGQDTIELRQLPCAEMRAQTYFPSCWNGRDLDSADHKSHVCVALSLFQLLVQLG